MPKRNRFARVYFKYITVVILAVMVVLGVVLFAQTRGTSPDETDPEETRAVSTEDSSASDESTQETSSEEPTEPTIAPIDLMKVTELMAFFRGMKMGDFGEFYGTVNMNAVMTSLNKFYTVRNKQLEKIYDNEKDEVKKVKERERKDSGLMAAEEYRNFLYDCKENGGGAERIREYLIEHGVKVTDGEHPCGRYPTLEECDPDRLIAMAEERERMMSEELKVKS